MFADDNRKNVDKNIFNNAATKTPIPIIKSLCYIM